MLFYNFVIDSRSRIFVEISILTPTFTTSSTVNSLIEERMGTLQYLDAIFITIAAGVQKLSA